MESKIYVGHGKEKFDGDMIEVMVNLSKISRDAKEHIFTLADKLKGTEDKHIKIKVCRRKEESEKGMTHYVQVDTWKPDAKKAKPEVKAEPSDETLPF